MNYNVGGVGDLSSWIDQDTKCTLTNQMLSPYFIPKVNSITLEYDAVLSSSFGMLSHT